jgi:hypothetical protein
MSDELEQGLRAALCAEQPDTDLAARVLARLPASRDLVKSRPSWKIWVPVALAASLAGAVFLRLQYEEQRELEAGMRARQQLLDALRVTSDKLDIAYQAVTAEEDQT